MSGFIQQLLSSNLVSSFLLDNIWLLYLIAFIIGGGLCLAWVALMAMAWTYGERKIAGFIQGRIGPNRVGPVGLFQPLADGIKLLTKEDIFPLGASRTLYILAPLLVFVGAFLPFVALPFTERLVVTPMALGLYYILAFEALEVMGVLMAGWAPNSKWSLYGGMRLAAQMLSYEIPMGICVLVVVLFCGSLNLQEIVAWQSVNAFGMQHPSILGWAVFRSPATFLAFFLFYIGGLASAKRAPFDLPEAESELVAGYHTEYSGMRFAFFFMAEYGAMYVICALSVLVFLGGWYGPIPNVSLTEASLSHRFIELATERRGLFAGSLALFADAASWKIFLAETISLVNFLGKTFFLYFVMIWARWTLPRIRIDQVLYLCLKVLLPFSVGALTLALLQVAFFP